MLFTVCPFSRIVIPLFVKFFLTAVKFHRLVMLFSLELYKESNPRTVKRKDRKVKAEVSPVPTDQVWKRIFLLELDTR